MSQPPVGSSGVLIVGREGRPRTAGSELLGPPGWIWPDRRVGAGRTAGLELFGTGLELFGTGLELPGPPGWNWPGRSDPARGREPLPGQGNLRPPMAPGASAASGYRRIWSMVMSRE